MKPLYHRPRRATRRAARRPAEAVAPGIDRALLRDDLQAIRDTDLLFCYGSTKSILHRRNISRT